MNTVLIIGLIFAGISAAIHILIAYMEMYAWKGSLARKIFGGTPEEAEPFTFYAYNQGLYNLFLAIEVIAGIIVTLFAQYTIGGTLMIAGVASMTAAAIGLVLKDNSYQAAAFKQGTFPAFALVFVIIGLLL
ncbi:DUF1304 domain-containing protein [Alloscardovia criceti]|uniref:DUF1304 domain-containing protein n=1 Tax=Alloscardovia criceti TaxID=356828 RepID=UPI000526146A|nr:DUF1304 domain-containing protein [Alloscardovia criceti]